MAHVYLILGPSGGRQKVHFAWEAAQNKKKTALSYGTNFYWHRHDFLSNSLHAPLPGVLDLENFFHLQYIYQFQQFRLFPLILANITLLELFYIERLRGNLLGYL